MLSTRLISAALALAVLIPTLLYSVLGVKLLLLAVIIFCLYEFHAMAQKKRFLNWLGTTIGTCIAFDLIFPASSNFHPILEVAFAFTLILFAVCLFCERDLTGIPLQLGSTFTGIFYIALPLSHIAFLRELPAGEHWILLTLAATFLGDTGAYFIGKKFGKRKLFPRISPGKSWEGFYAQITSAILGALLWRQFLMPNQPAIRDTLVIGAICGLLGPLGDLCESMLKRAFGVKDSGNIMPGHGGLLDRVDGLLFTAPAVYYYITYTCQGH